MNIYRGRFAPSPSGPLHFGSLVAALGSWLDARSNDGEWLLRIEDIDPPREIAGASDDILHTLEKYGLYWDQQVSYQSSNLNYYQQMLDQLLTDGLLYRCTCTRKQILSTGNLYQNLCRDKKHPVESIHSLRIKIKHPVFHFDDCFQGLCNTNPEKAGEDFILKRKDGLYAYMLAVVVDDAEQQITHVIRGADLLDTTTQQLSLFNILKKKPPVYGHLPLVVNAQGLKFSKQNHATAIDVNNTSSTIFKALSFLKQEPPNALRLEHRDSILKWAIQNWNPQLFRGKSQFHCET